MIRETTESIGFWANQAFGPAPDAARIAVRANEEMAELLRAVTTNQSDAVVIEECADIVIVLARLVHEKGGDLEQAVNDKMAINRARTWKLDGTGHGYHVRDKSAAP